MSQIFSMDAQNPQGGTALAVAAPPVAVVTTNALTPPFGNCKAAVSAVLDVFLPFDATGVDVEIIRNPDAEAITLATFSFTPVTGHSQDLSFAVAATDAIPDGRDVVYQVTARMVDGSVDGGVSQAYLEATLISG